MAGSCIACRCYAFVFMAFTMANVGLPGTSGFVGEFLTMIGTFQVSTWTVFGAAFGVILSAAYALWLYRRVIFGRLTKESLKDILDLNWREGLILVPLVVLVIFFGFYPAPILDATAASSKAIVAQYQAVVGQPTPLAKPGPAAAARLRPKRQSRRAPWRPIFRASAPSARSCRKSCWRSPPSPSCSSG